MAYSNIKMSDIAVVSSTLHDLSGVVNDLSGVVNDLSVTPVSDPLPRNFEITADKELIGNDDTTFDFQDTLLGASDTTVYSQGITHTNNTNLFTISTAGQYLISYFLQADDTTSPNSNSRLYGYSCIRREDSGGNLVYEYKMASEYLRNLNDIDDIILCGTTNITFNVGDRFKIIYYRVRAQTSSSSCIIKKSLSNLRIERIKYTAT